MVVANRYRVGQRIGEGGMSVVWEGTNLVTLGVVALKVQKQSSPERLHRFLREARIAASLRHPNVATVHDVHGLTGKTPAVMVMDRLVGETLAARISNGPLSVDATSRVVLAVVAALEHAHARGVVHRDIKPDNIFLTNDGKVLDFGIAAITSQVAGTLDTATGTVLGTAHYMAPEQLFGEKHIDHRADVWALGVVLYQCLTGRRPFDGDNAGQVFKAVATGSAESWEPGLAELPEGIAALVRSALVRERSARTCTLADFRAALTPFETGQALSRGVVARTADLSVDPYGLTFASTSAPRKLPWRLATPIAIAVLLAGAAFGVRATRRHSDPMVRAEQPPEPLVVPAAAAPPLPIATSPPLVASLPSVAPAPRRPRAAAPAPSLPARLAGGVAAESPY